MSHCIATTVLRYFQELSTVQQWYRSRSAASIESVGSEKMSLNSLWCAFRLRATSCGSRTNKTHKFNKKKRAERTRKKMEEIGMERNFSARPERMSDEPSTSKNFICMSNEREWDSRYFQFENMFTWQKQIRWTLLNKRVEYISIF